MILPKLHVPTEERILLRSDFLELARRVARSPEVALHLRGRTLGGRRLWELALALAAELRPTGAALFVNDRVDVALAAKAPGVHLPSQGMPITAARSLLGGQVFIGRSVHSPAEARAAFAEGADYVFLGPIWETTSHPQSRPLGLEAIERALPGRIVAIGGITPERAAECLRAGAYGVAAISALWDAPDPAAAAEGMLLSLRQAVGR